MIPKTIKFSIYIAFLLFSSMIIARFLFLASFIDKNSPPEVSHTLMALYLGMKFDLRLSLLSIIPLVLAGVIPLLNPFKYYWARWVWYSWSILTFIAISLLYIFDFANYRFLGMRIDASFLRFAKDTETSLTMIWQSYPVIIVFLSILIASLIFFYLVVQSYRKLAKLDSRSLPSKYIRYPAAALCVMLITLGIYGKLSWYPLRWSEAFFSNNDFVSSLSINPVLFFAQTFKNRTIEADPDSAKKAYNNIANYLDIEEKDRDSLNYMRTVQNPNPKLQGYNIVIVVLESFAYYKTGLSGNPLSPTPYFDQLGKNGLLFDRFYVPHAGTARSIFTAVTGLPDIELNETSSRNPLLVNQHTIINEFSEYKKLYFLGGSANWGQIRGLLTRNIQDLEIYEEGSYESPRIDAWGISDLDLFSEAVDTLDKQTQPFISLIQTSGNHSPYTLPDHTEGFEKENHSDSDVEPYGFVSNAALNSFRFMDFSIGKFIEKAKKKEFFKNTLFVFFGDHGLIRSADHMFPGEEKLLLTQGHVPLLFYAPAIFHGETKDIVASEVDVMPSIASLTLPKYRNNTLGRDLFNSKFDSDRKAFVIRHQYGPEIGIIGTDYLFKMKADGSNKKLNKIFSKKPEKNLYSVQQETASKMERFTKDYYETIKYLRYNNQLTSPPETKLSCESKSQGLLC